MSIFLDGELSRYSFPTSQGLLDIIAEVTITGSKLELRDPPADRSPREVAGIHCGACTGKRLSGATPGRAVLLERKIR
jgi:hypothetical protein